MKNEDYKEVIYLLINTHDHNVISYGISFQHFIQSLQKPLNNILLLKHKQEESEFHLDTQFSYLNVEQLKRLSNQHHLKLSEFCWVDFEDVFNLDTVEGQELAELLYVGHLKKHLSLPFFKTLNNRFVYLTKRDGWLNKTYYKNWSDFYNVLSGVFAKRLEETKLDKPLIQFWKKRTYPPIEHSVLQQLNSILTEGVVFSFPTIRQSRNQIDIPFWIIGDYYDMDDMLEIYKEKSSKPPFGKLCFDKKQKVWSVIFL